MKAPKKPMKKSSEKNVSIRHANLDDAVEIQKLINQYASKRIMLARSLNEIYEKIREYVVIVKNGKLMGCCALHICWNDIAEIRSLAVLPRHTKKGYGSMLVEYELWEAKMLGVPRVFALTYQVPFFEKMGFQVMDVKELPKKVWADCINCVHFPNCNETALIYDF